ncbi:MAG: hypothetical protein KBG15_23870 [Kofleriaceae bacterium]|nr:hypothetical protein [Kofleriaceae bacterium]
MFDSWLRSPLVAVVRDALGEVALRGEHTLVVGDAALAKALIGAGHASRAAAVSARAAKYLPALVAGSAQALVLADHSLAALVGFGAGGSDGAARLAEWVRVVQPGGRIVLIDRCDLGKASGRALCAGLGEIEQRSSGRTVITSGVVPAR